ncbi:MAG: NADP-dependent isocitrate dehydrogenase, partial [Candidatus Kapabacteria bacterium]|nr:NADP-dependent isocitrate dehydrogenase [Candidatus Kapabacteria bacterium]
VTCFAKDNIMKMTDGLFHRIFDEIGAEYPDLEKEFWIVDIGAAKMADSPELFDVIVMPNLYGDILSDVAAQIAGSVGLAGSANIGDHAAMFEAIHGSAPRRAGQNLANPSGLLLGSLLMLQHIGQGDVAAKVHNAWLKTLEDGVHTYDIYKEGVSKEKVGTKEFAQAVISRIGDVPATLKSADYGDHKPMKLWTPTPRPNQVKTLVGVDVFIEDAGDDVNAIGEKVNALSAGSLTLNIITNRGVRVYPNGRKETFCTDHYRCRFKSNDGTVVSHDQVIALLQAFRGAGMDFIKTEHLYQFDGVDGFSSTH